MAARTIAYDHQIFSLQQYGGISRYFCELASHVDQTPGFRAKITAGIHFNVHLAEANVPKLGTYVPMRVPRSQRLYRAINSLLSPSMIAAARPSLIHRTYYRPMPRRQTQRPTVVTVYDMIHELFPSHFHASDTTSRNKRICVERADHIVCISHSTANDLVRLFGVDRTRVSVTHLGFSSEFSSEPPDALGTPHVRPYLLYVGHRDGYKNFETVLRAYADCASLHCEFDLYAFGGPAFNVAELALIRSLNLRPDSVVHASGPDRQLARAYKHARAFVYPSKYEGFGIPPLEAMASGCPVTCANTSSLPEVVGAAAATFDPNDSTSVTSAMESVCHDEALRTSLIAAGKLRAMAFSWQRCAEETMAVYEKVIGKA
jgi:glycosyltransferase involved in cell wall biosynthesis